MNENDSRELLDVLNRIAQALANVALFAHAISDELHALRAEEDAAAAAELLTQEGPNEQA